MSGEENRDAIWKTVIELIAGAERAAVDEPLVSTHTELWNIDGYVSESDIEARVDADNSEITAVLNNMEEYGFLTSSVEELPTVADDGVQKEQRTLYRPAGPFADSESTTSSTESKTTTETDLGVTELFST